jgi:toxin YoeB
VRLAWTSYGWADYVHWQTTDRALVKRINRLIEDALRDPTAGIGKPERLKYGIADTFSRRITDEHRLVHKVDGDDLVIVQARHHYDE